MSERLVVDGRTKEDKYAILFPQIESVIAKERDIIANMANISSMVHFTFDFLWTGFYRVLNGELVLGPFQGPLACVRIRKGRGVCGMAWQQEQTLIVPDVELFEGHIACSSLSQSEIVIPVFEGNTIVAVFDIDSQRKNTFDLIDKKYLESIVALLYAKN
ncbi:MAG: GAF domain-containing protein [Bacteroidales bacterium]